jgi:hypothetical protein
VTVQLQRRAARLQLAQQHYEQRLMQQSLLTWQAAAAELALQQLQLEAAAEWHRRRLLKTALRALVWYCW